MKRTVKIVLMALIITVVQIGVIQAQWYFGAPMNYARHGLDVVEYENRIYAIGGWYDGTRLEVYEDGVWSELAPLPQSQEGVAAAIVGDRIYTFGDYGGSNITQIYDIGNDSWEAGPNIPQNLYWSTAETIGDNIYLIGGWAPGALNTIYILNTITNSWTQGSNLPVPFQIPSSAVYDNHIYVFKNNGYYVYDVATDTWSPFNGPPSGHGSAAEAVTVGDKIYLIGGCPGALNVVYRDVEIYNTATQRWSTDDSLNVGRHQFGATYVEGKLYAVGGRDQTASSLSSVEILDVGTNPVSITLTPFATPIQIPFTGGSFDFNIEVGNSEPSPVTIDIWTSVTLPNGSEYGPIINVPDFNAPAGCIGDRDRTQAIPASAPTGMYTYDAYVGVYPDTLFDEDHFDFEKLATGDGVIISNWANWGEEFGDFDTSSEAVIPSEFGLHSVYPNPFNPTTNIRFDLPEAGEMSLKVYNIQGKEVAKLVDGYKSAGTYSITFNAKNLVSGVYFVKLEAGQSQETQKLLLIK